MNNDVFVHSWCDLPMIFTRDFVTRENHWQITSLVNKKPLFTITLALFFIHILLRVCYPTQSIPWLLASPGQVSAATCMTLINFSWKVSVSLQWCHNGRDGVSNHQLLDCLLKRLSRRRSKKHQSSASLALVRGIHRWPVNSPHKGPVTQKMFPFDDVIISAPDGSKPDVRDWPWIIDCCRDVVIHCFWQQISLT